MFHSRPPLLEVLRCTLNVSSLLSKLLVGRRGLSSVVIASATLLELQVYKPRIKDSGLTKKATTAVILCHSVIGQHVIFGLENQHIWVGGGNSVTEAPYSVEPLILSCSETPNRTTTPSSPQPLREASPRNRCFPDSPVNDQENGVNATLADVVP